MERAEWTDARIGDQFRSLWQAVNALGRTNERLAVVDRELAELARIVANLAQAEDVHECREAIKALSDAFTRRAEAREAERKAAAIERKKDRRYWAATALAAATLVVGAVAVLIPLLAPPN